MLTCFPRFLPTEAAHKGHARLWQRQGFRHPVDPSASPFQTGLLCPRALPHLSKDHRHPPSYRKTARPGHEGHRLHLHASKSPQGGTTCCSRDPAAREVAPGRPLRLRRSPGITAAWPAPSTQDVCRACASTEVGSTAAPPLLMAQD